MILPVLAFSGSLLLVTMAGAVYWKKKSGGIRPNEDLAVVEAALEADEVDDVSSAIDGELTPADFDPTLSPPPSYDTSV